jgi:hypothetical protein
VVPKLIVLTPPAAGAVDCQVVPLLVKTLPAVPGATTCTAEAPLPSRTLLAVRVVAPVPPFPTGSVPVTPVVRGNPVALVSVPDEGVPNAPPFTTGAPAEPILTARAVATPVPNPETPVPIGSPVPLVNVTEVGVPRIGVTNVGLVDSTVLPVPVLVVTPVPPLATANVPATVTAPLVAVLGVNPVVPKLIVETAASAELAQVVPLLVNTFPAVPGATACNADVPLPNRTLLAASVVDPVPPLATPRVPVSVNVPVLVIGPPENDIPVVPPDALTDVTPPPGGTNTVTQAPFAYPSNIPSSELYRR